MLDQDIPMSSVATRVGALHLNGRCPQIWRGLPFEYSGRFVTAAFALKGPRFAHRAVRDLKRRLFKRRRPSAFLARDDSRMRKLGRRPKIGVHNDHSIDATV